jgi:hypothetical protein
MIRPNLVRLAPARLAPEEQATQLLPELVERRVADVAGLGCPREVQLVHSSQEAAELVHLHGARPAR